MYFMRWLRESDLQKLGIARRLRRETTMTLHWIAERLYMGSRICFMILDNCMTNHGKKIRENSKMLEKFAKQFPAKSPEHEALKLSAFAFAYVILHHEDEFYDYIENLHKPLTSELVKGSPIRAGSQEHCCPN